MHMHTWKPWRGMWCHVNESPGPSAQRHARFPGGLPGLFSIDSDLYRPCLQRLGFVEPVFFDSLDTRPEYIHAFKLQVCLLDLYLYLQAKLTVAKASNSLESLPPALLTRARSIANEYDELNKKLANGFDTKAARKLGELSPVVKALKEWEKANDVCGR